MRHCRGSRVPPSVAAGAASRVGACRTCSSSGRSVPAVSDSNNHVVHKCMWKVVAGLLPFRRTSAVSGSVAYTTASEPEPSSRKPPGYDTDTISKLETASFPTTSCNPALSMCYSAHRVICFRDNKTMNMICEDCTTVYQNRQTQ